MRHPIFLIEVYQMHPKRLRVILTVIAIIAVWAMVFPFPAAASLKPGITPDYTELVNAIDREMASNKIPGLSIAVFDEHDIIYADGFGVKNITTGAAVDQNTRFVAASISKTVTAYAALILVKRGLLDLDAPLAQYLKSPYLPDAKAAAKISLRMILTHTSGLSNDASGKDRKVYSAPGAYFSYSSGGFRYLQQVMEDVTGESFADFVKAEILDPLGMSASSYSYQEEYLPDWAFGHYSGKSIDLEPLRKVSVNASYSLIATPSDIARFAMELCQPTLLDQDMVSQMIRPAVKYRNGVYWGLGIGILSRPDGDLLWHWGNNVTYQNMMLINPQAKNGVIVMTNSTNGLATACRVAIQVANTFLIHDDNPLPDSAFDFLNNI